MRRTALLLASTALALVLMSSTAWALLTKAADWQMDEPPEAPGLMLDSSGNNNNGTPTDVLQTGSAYVFDGSTSRVRVEDADSLDPQANDITLTARVRVGVGEDTTAHQMDDDSYDVVRKGFVTTEGGDYKMEIKRTADPAVGKLHCFFRGDQASVNKVANRDVVDGDWHTLECEKTGDSVAARVDGRSYTRLGSAGSIDNESVVMVGAKKADPLDDVFDGSMDYVRIDIAQPDVDTTAPTVLSAAPTGRKVPRKANATATFSEAMNETTVEAPGTFTLKKKGSAKAIAASVTYDPNTRKATLNPTRQLRPGAAYMAKVTTAAKDSAGNALDQKPGVSGNQPKKWSFKVRN